jgi:hypothetical protein
MKLTSANIRTLAICFGAAAISGVCVYDDSQQMAQYERDPAGYMEQRNKDCLDLEIHYKLRDGTLDKKDLTEKFSLSSLLSSQEIESCEAESLKSAEKLQSNRLSTGLFGGIFGLMGVLAAADLYRRRNKGAEPK